MEDTKLKVEFLLVETFGGELGSDIVDLYKDGYILTKVLYRDKLIEKVSNNNNDEETLKFIEYLKLNFNISDHFFDEDFDSESKSKELNLLLVWYNKIFKFEKVGE